MIHSICWPFEVLCLMTIYHKDFRFSSNFKHHFFSGKKWWLVSRQPFPAPPRSRQTGHPPTGDVSLREKFSTKGAAHVFFCLNKKVPPNDLPHVPHNNVFELRGLEKNSLLGQWLNGICFWNYIFSREISRRSNDLKISGSFKWLAKWGFPTRLENKI